MKCKAKQIRSYVLHPVGRVVDHRTGLEASDVRSVLDGKLDGFMEAALYGNVSTPTPTK